MIPSPPEKHRREHVPAITDLAAAVGSPTPLSIRTIAAITDRVAVPHEFARLTNRIHVAVTAGEHRREHLPAVPDLAAAVGSPAPLSVRAVGAVTQIVAIPQQRTVTRDRINDPTISEHLDKRHPKQASTILGTNDTRASRSTSHTTVAAHQ